MAEQTAQGTYQGILAERQGPVFTISLNKPPMNVIDLAMMEEIIAAIGEANADPGVRAIAFRGTGPKGFSAGVSVPEHKPDLAPKVIPRFHDIFRELVRTEKVTAAAVHGFCLGGGFELACMCDLVVASDNAKFGQPEIKLGQLPPVGVILLPHLMGYRKGAEMLFTGNSISAAQAEAAGLVNRVVPGEQLTQALDDLLREVTSLSGVSLRLTKRILSRVTGLDFEKLLAETEAFFLKDFTNTADAKEGIFAFLEKRAPQWTHR